MRFFRIHILESSRFILESKKNLFRIKAIFFRIQKESFWNLVGLFLESRAVYTPLGTTAGAH